jgi:hypothetical protein
MVKAIVSLLASAGRCRTAEPFRWDSHKRVGFAEGFSLEAGSHIEEGRSR